MRIALIALIIRITLVLGLVLRARRAVVVESANSLEYKPKLIKDLIRLSYSHRFLVEVGGFYFSMFLIGSLICFNFSTRTECVMWIKNEVIHILGVSMWISNEVIHILGIKVCITCE